MFVTTFYRRAVESNLFCDNVDNPDFQRINGSLGINYGTSYIEAADVLKDHIWGKIDLPALVRTYTVDDKQLDTVEAKQISKTVIREVPYWIKYDERQMIVDLCFVLGNKPIRVCYA